MNRPPPPQVGAFGPKARRWKGEDASYAAKHMWIHKHYGKASYCENDSSHRSSRFEWANISGTYQRERSDYKQLCRKCHIEMDRRTVCRNGHKKTKENTYITKNGWHDCRQCRKESQRKYVAKNNKV